MVIALVPVLIAALAVREPALPPAPAEPLPAFNGNSAATKAASLLSLPDGRGPGSPGDLAAAGWVRQQLDQLGYRVSVQNFAADLPDQANVPMRNVIGYLPGRRPELIAVIAHHDGTGTGADDNASSLGVMVELAAELKPLAHERGLVFVSTDGGTSGGQGAIEFDRRWPLAAHVESAIVLDSVAAPRGDPIQVVIRPDVPRGTSPTLVRTARSAIARATGQTPVLPGLLDQLSGLAIPYALNEQGPLIARGMPAVTLTAGPPPDPNAGFSSYDPNQLADVGNSTANLVTQLDGATTIDPGGRPDLFLGTRTVRGWLAQLALVALFAPPLACVLDMTARCRRRRLPLAPAAAALAWRMLTFSTLLVALWLLPALPGNLASGLNVAPRPDAIGITWTGILLAAMAGAATWRFAAGPRLVPRQPVAGGERTAGLVAGMLGMCFAGTLLVAVNPFALILVLPAAHLWLLLPSAARLGRRFMLVVYLLGFSGGALLGAGVRHPLPPRPFDAARAAGDDRQRLPVAGDRPVSDARHRLGRAGRRRDRGALRTCAFAQTRV